ncbi:preprotein translocase subunit YajC [Moraxella osloensis]|nr:preprotein translocase subunit YajC [Moraxella osloensis]MCK6157884.1 preprotein translocase subunit YajC [Moraxella osloensis]QRO14500.1 preprotein translocase subunit YajC [Moraxella osloensis]
MLLTAILAFIQSAHAEGAATAPTGTGVSTIMQMLLPLAFFAIFYFIIIRPQSRRNKEHRQMIDAIKEGDEVVFAGGLMGKIKKLQGEYAVVALNNTQEVMVQRASIISVLPVGTIDSLK